MVEVAGLEPAASWSRTKRATKLRYTSFNYNNIYHFEKKCNLFAPRLQNFITAGKFAGLNTKSKKPYAMQ